MKRIEDVKVGDWYSFDNEDDLHQIQEEEIEFIIAWLHNYPQYMPYHWQSQREALLFWLFNAKNDAERAARIQARLQKLDTGNTEKRPWFLLTICKWVTGIRTAVKRIRIR